MVSGRFYAQCPIPPFIAGGLQARITVLHTIDDALEEYNRAEAH